MTKEYPNNANCIPLIEGDPETFDKYFFPDNYNSAVVKMAKRICGQCVVRDECLEVALSEDAEHGIYGGTTPAERYFVFHHGGGDAA